MKLISVEELKERFKNLRGKSFDEIRVIDEMPEHTGQWKCIDSFFRTYKCTKCDSVSVVFDEPYRYCPCCGARMAWSHTTKRENEKMDV